jgi:nicotinamidase-related amidase
MVNIIITTILTLRWLLIANLKMAIYSLKCHLFIYCHIYLFIHCCLPISTIGLTMCCSSFVSMASSSSVSSRTKSYALVAAASVAIGAMTTIAVSQWRRRRQSRRDHLKECKVDLPLPHHHYHHQGVYQLHDGGHRHVPPPLVHAMSPIPSLHMSIPSSTSLHGPSLLVVIDMQNAFSESSPWATPGFHTLESPITRLVQAAGSISSDRVVFTRFTMPADGHRSTYGTSWYDYYAHPSSSFFAADNDEAKHAAELTPYYASLAAKGKHDIIPSATFGKCDTSLIARAWKIAIPSISTTSKSATSIPPTLVLCGVSTDCCVLATALAAIDAGLRVRVVRDACAATNHDRSLTVMKFFEPQITVTTVEQEMDLLRIR